MNKMINEFNKARTQLFSHVGFKEDWVILPIEDLSGYYWKIKNNKVLYGLKHDVEKETGNHYADEIFKQRFYDKWTYEGKELTMIFCDPHVDGVQWFKFFENKLRLKC